MSLTFDTSHRASMGARRYQEDACAFAPLRISTPAPAEPTATTVPIAASGPGTGVVAVLADGMGGHVGGERASNTACEGFLGGLSSFPGDASDHLLAALASANEAIRREGLAEPSLHGMGCTLIGAVFGTTGETAALRWVSVGDSRLFLFRAGELFQLNEDHSLAPLLDQLVAQGELTQEQAREHPRRHHLRSALTGDPIEMVDHASENVALRAGDCVVLASDGIDTLAADAIADVIEEHRGEGARAIATALIDTVDRIARPGQDNTTVMAILVRD
jgi:PPM family protein phosphatase